MHFSKITGERGDMKVGAIVAVILAFLTLMTAITITVICLPAPTVSAGGSFFDPVDTPSADPGANAPEGGYPNVGNFKNAQNFDGCSVTVLANTPTLSQIDSKNAIVVDMSSQIALYAKGADERIQIASMTKVMTLITALDLIETNDDMYRRVVIKSVYGNRNLDGYQKAFRAGESVYVIDLLYSLILQSGCDSALALAELLAGSEEAFVLKMNEKAGFMGLDNTHFSNCYGADDEGRNYSSVHDVAEIFSYALKNELAKKILTTKSNTYMYYGHEGYSNAKFCQSMVLDGIARRDTGTAKVLGGKSGNDTMAGYCLVSFGQSSSGDLYLVVAAGDNVNENSYADSAKIYKTYVN